VAPSLRDDRIAVSGDPQLLDAILDSAASLIMVVDAEGRLVRWNRACEELLGYTAEELRAPGGVLDLIPAAERAAAIAAARSVLGGESPVSADFHWRTRGGAFRLIEWSATALTGADGGVTHIVATGTDVTEARRWDEERVATEERLRHIADHDALTGLFNRRRFEEEVERHIALGRRYGISGALLLIDLDDFKHVNDGFGHRAGDAVLTAVADVLDSRLRESDVVARFGGDEFAVLMPVGGETEAAELAEVLTAAVHREVQSPAGPLYASVGYAVFDESTTSDEILSRADDAMYADKGAAHPHPRHLRSVE
jgi:diguanylate cyclase (GGDEF)-like protein/PAS domain S-box-containing protein